jgi:hypothetical protein
MKCKTLHKKLIFFLDGDLSAEEMEQMRLHLSECNDCATFAEDMKKTLAILEFEKSPEVNPFFYTRLKTKLENQTIKQDRISLNPVWARILQPSLFSVLLIAGIYSGIKIGQTSTVNSKYASYTEKEIIPYLDEMETETIETFLMK